MSLKFVKIFYGPFLNNHTYGHRPQQLRGIRDSLLKHGYRVSLIPIDYVDKCVFEVCGYAVFTCNIRNLRFNSAVEYDSVAQKALDAILDATERLTRTRCYLWSWMMLDDQIFKRNAFLGKDHWIQNVEIEPMEDHVACMDCCKIMLAQQTQVRVEEVGSSELMLTFDEPYSELKNVAAKEQPDK